jgi:hypothetical protein
MPPKQPARRQSTLSFYGEDIIAYQELDPNETYVPIVTLCARLGLERATQERRVRGHAVLAGGARTLPIELEDGRTTPALCLRIDLLPLWLAGVESGKVSEAARARLELFQRESASVLWQAHRPQGFGPEDEFLPTRHEQNPSEQSYVAALAMATLARQQMLIERQLDARGLRDDPQRPPDGDPTAPGGALDDRQAELLARAVRRVALAAAERTRRNEYNGVYNGLFRQFGIASYRRMPPARLREALEWLERWRGDLMGEPEPPPDIE